MKGETRISAFPTKRLKYLVTLRRSPVTEDDATLPYIGLEDIESGTGRLAGDRGINSENPSLPDQGRKASGIYFERGDVLFGKLRPYLMKSWVAEFPGRCTTEALVMTPHAIEARFLRSVCLSPKFVDTVDASTFGSKMPRAEWSFIGDMPVPVPDWERQRAIADFLDRETERLDALVAAKERLLGLLAEKRQALIDHAVTGRLDPQTLSCNAGAPTAGEERSDRTNQRSITEHDWREVRFRYLAEVRKGVIPVSGIESNLDSELLPYLTMEYLRGDSSEPNLVPVDPSLLVAPDESILLLWDGANAGEFFRTKRGVVSSTSALVVPRGVERNFFYWACKNLEDRIRSQTIGMGVPHVNGDFLANMVIPLPSPLRQRAIADYLDRETARIDELAARTRDTIALLRERRAALVAAAVTGQLAVDGAADGEAPDSAGR